MKRFQQEKENKKNKLQRLMQLFLLGTASILVILQIVVSNSFSTAGETILKLENEAKTLEKENELLQSQIFEKSSLHNIEKQAKILGFVKVNNIISINTAMPIAFNK